MGKMSQLHAETAPDRADAAEREVGRLEAENDTLRWAVEALLGELNREPLGRTRPFSPTVVRPTLGGRWLLMNKQETGWSSSARPFDTLQEIADTFRVTFAGVGRDECSTFLRVEPR